jgi:succinate dehydrogenase / fumarate reductase iron-sulfur subunit
MKAQFRIFRFDPDKDEKPYYQDFTLDVSPTDRILDCLNRIRWEQDPTLAYRMSCAHGVCGSDGMRINSVCALACQRLVKDYEGAEFLIEPLPVFKVVKDLIVDLDLFFEKYRAVTPYLMAESPPPEKERLQDRRARAEFDVAIRCILCACCSAACPISSQNEKYLGPAALLRAFRYLFDSRDRGEVERIQVLDNEDGIWGCQTLWKCTQVCPKEIPVTQCLGRIKRKIYDMKRGE